MRTDETGSPRGVPAVGVRSHTSTHDPAQRIEAALRGFFPGWDATAAADPDYAAFMRQRMALALLQAEPPTRLTISPLQAEALAREWAATITQKMDSNLDLECVGLDHDVVAREIEWELKRLLSGLAQPV